MSLLYNVFKLQPNVSAAWVLLPSKCWSVASISDRSASLRFTPTPMGMLALPSCGRLTGRTFAPGHDARLKGLILRVLAAVMTLDDVAAWGGEDTRAAVEAAIGNVALLKRWNIEVPAAEVVEEGPVEEIIEEAV